MSRVTTRFGAESTADEVVAGVDLTSKRAIVTGAASGIGIPTARAVTADSPRSPNDRSPACAGLLSRWS